MTVGRHRLYGDLAWLWPTLSPPEHYRDEAAWYAETFRRNPGRPVRRVLHLGPGGGHIDRWLKAEFAVTGIDISPAMLGLARALNPEVRYIEGDMRTARLGETFDAVCVFDSIDYMTSEADLAAAFQTAWDHLEPGGMFLTYAETLKETYRDNETRVEQEEGPGLALTLVEHTFDPDPGDDTAEMTYVFLIRRGSELSIETDRHTFGLFAKATWVRLLEGVGFAVRAVDVDFWPEDYADPAVFVAVKPLGRP